MESPPKSPMSCNKNTSTFPEYVYLLLALILFFLLRVIAQLIQQLKSVSWLPPIDVWQGSSLPYGFLLSTQIIILGVMIRITRQHARACVQKNPIKGKWLLIFGALYFFSMSARLVIGLANFSTHPWFHKPIPAFFHLVLATFVLLLAAFHRNWICKNNKLN
ncbi:MAG: hypothetical protein V4443_10530 [Pseudomonadota bacterium]